MDYNKKVEDFEKNTNSSCTSSNSLQRIPSTWTKHGEIFSDDESRSVFVCSACITSQADESDRGFVAFDAVTFWAHIQENHLININNPKRRLIPRNDTQSNNAVEPSLKIAKVQNIIVIDDEDDIIETRNFKEEKAEVNFTSSVNAPQDMVMECKVEPEVFAPQQPKEVISIDLDNDDETDDDSDEVCTVVNEPLIDDIHKCVMNESTNDYDTYIDDNNESKQLNANSAKVQTVQLEKLQEEQTTLQLQRDQRKPSDDHYLLRIVRERDIFTCQNYQNGSIVLSDDETDDDDHSSSSPPLTNNFNSCGYSCICPECKESFTTTKQFLKHIKQHENCTSTNIISHFVTLNKFANFSRTDSHMQTHISDAAIKPFSLQNIPSPAVSPSDFNFPTLAPNATAERPFKCNYCDSCFCAPWQLDRHQRIHLLSKKKSYSNRPYQCNNCGKRTCTEKSMITHRRRFHTLESDKETTKCDICEKLILKINLRQHKMVHSHVRTYQCRFCKCSYKQKQSLTLHLKKAHHDALAILPLAANHAAQAARIYTQPRLSDEEHKVMFDLFMSLNGNSLPQTSAINNRRSPHA